MTTVARPVRPVSGAACPAWRPVPGQAAASVWLALALLCMLLAWPARAQGLGQLVTGAGGAGAQAARAPVLGAQRVDAVEAELVAERTAVSPGQALRVGLRLRHEAGWHTYWRNPGDSGLPTELSLELPPGWKAGPIEWPAPERIAVGPLANYGYSGEIVLPVTLQVPAEASGDQARITARAQWLVCREVCVPGEAALALEVPLLRAGEAATSRWAPLFVAMAARTPGGPALPARLHVDSAGAMSLVFDSAAAAVEFFPYESGVIQPSGAQVLHDVGQGRRRLDLQRAELPASDEVPQRLAGLVIADGRPIELDARRDASPAPDGRRIGVALAAAGEPDAAPGAALGAAALAAAIASGLVGGLLLNLMPCVFPVIGLKLVGFAQDAAGDASGVRRQAWAFAAGIVLAFWALAALLLGLRAAGEAVGWGFQLQSPGFVAAMALLFVAIGLNFSGVYEVGAALTRLGQAPAAQGSHGPAGAFGAGLLATLVATPCTAPFMGSAVGFTLGQPAAVVLTVMGAVGVGMALPYVALAYVPGLLQRLPRPGRWMESFKQFLAFPMYATAAWLAWVLGQQAGLDATLRLMIGAVLLGLAAWVWGRFVQLGRKPAAALVSAAALAAAAALSWSAAAGQPDSAAPAAAFGSTASRASGLPGSPATGSQATGAASTQAAVDDGWLAYDEARLQALRAQGRTVFVDFTAAWCISCKVNEKLVIDAGSVREAFARQDVALMRADWTRRDPRITRALAEFGRNGVPLYLVYRPGRDRPAVLPELLTPTAVLRALEG